MNKLKYFYEGYGLLFNVVDSHGDKIIDRDVFIKNIKLNASNKDFILYPHYYKYY